MPETEIKRVTSQVRVQLVPAPFVTTERYTTGPKRDVMIESLTVAFSLDMKITEVRGAGRPVLRSGAPGKGYVPDVLMETVDVPAEALLAAMHAAGDHVYGTPPGREAG